MTFVKYSPEKKDNNKAGLPFISVAERYITFNTPAVNKWTIQGADSVVVYLDKENRKIAFELCTPDNPDPEGLRLTHITEDSKKRPYFASKIACQGLIRTMSISKGRYSLYSEKINDKWLLIASLADEATAKHKWSGVGKR